MIKTPEEIIKDARDKGYEKFFILAAKEAPGELIQVTHEHNLEETEDDALLLAGMVDTVIETVNGKPPEGEA